MNATRLFVAALLLPAGAPALAQSTIPASSADWILEGSQPTGTFGIRVAPAGDVDGDGYDDVLVGDSSYDGAFPDSGRITLYRGSASGLATSPAWELAGSVAGAALSQAFPAGDVNGDGFDDVIVNDSGRGALALFLGSPAGLLTPTSWSYPGFPVGGGDVNGDGFADVGVYNRPNVAIFMGSAAGLAAAPATTIQAGDFLDGPAFADLNGDGFADLAYSWRECSKDCIYLIARISIHLGSTTGLKPLPKRVIDFRGEEVVPFVAAAGDVDGDGFGDLAVTVFGDIAGAYYRPEDVLLFRGSRVGVRPQFDQILRVTRGTLVPRSGGSGGDLNGDGFADLLVPESYDYQPVVHALMVFRGGAGGLSTVPSTVIEAEQPSDGFPDAASRAGDVNGDGFGDVIVGAPGFSSGGTPVGRVYVFYGRSTF